MKKVISISLLVLLLFSLTACGGKSVLKFVDIFISDTSTTQDAQDIPSPQKEVAELSDEKHKMVGIWESEDKTCLIGIRARAKATQDLEDNYDLDMMMYFEDFYGTGEVWAPITRGNSDVTDGVYSMTDTHLCPDPKDPDKNVYSTYYLSYDEATDTIYYYETVGNEKIYNTEFTLNRTDLDIETIPWDYYYDIYYERNPR